MQQELGLTYFFVRHDLGVIRYICDEVAVIYRGKLVESGPVEDIFERPTNELHACFWRRCRSRSGPLTIPAKVTA
ncbi:hypothetical protein [Rhizobium metallidurans]|uniref:ABC-type glutathione transport system ATPase component n=1 Tax=Rhizobium metallidurans TaxID=1265931 RepID=A0A7W6CUZ4_9HYPH|nr:hypothetical protein [Rhizobium metallidurans]MBB3965407.1 ABC-type glutathione transport system ATPase component [Rhizobium metallidurans]